jgi:AcrR family transcriptional regulator
VHPALDRRGRYDRSLSAADRAERQRAHLIEAGAAALDEVGGAELTVDHVVGRARMGRNTFYAHFDGLSDLMGGVREHALEQLLSEVDDAVARCRTPLERLRAMAEAWLGAVAARPVLSRAALSHVVGVDPRHLGSGGVDDVAARLRDVTEGARRDGLLAAVPHEPTLRGVAGAFVAVALSVVDRRRPVSLDDATAALVELTVRALR